MVNNDIKEDLFMLYKTINQLANSKEGKAIFNNTIFELVKTPIKDVEQILFEKSISTNKNTKVDIDDEMSNISNKTDAISYMENLKLKHNTLIEFEKQFNLKELKFLYFKIFEIDISKKNISKKNIMQDILNYIDSQNRALDLSKGLF